MEEQFSTHETTLIDTQLPFNNRTPAILPDIDYECIAVSPLKSENPGLKQKQKLPFFVSSAKHFSRLTPIEKKSSQEQELTKPQFVFNRPENVTNPKPRIYKVLRNSKGILDEDRVAKVTCEQTPISRSTIGSANFSSFSQKKEIPKTDLDEWIKKEQARQLNRKNEEKEIMSHRRKQISPIPCSTSSRNRNFNKERIPLSYTRDEYENSSTCSSYINPYEDDEEADEEYDRRQRLKSSEFSSYGDLSLKESASQRHHENISSKQKYFKPQDTVMDTRCPTLVPKAGTTIQRLNSCPGSKTSAPIHATRTTTSHVFDPVTFTGNQQQSMRTNNVIYTDKPNHFASKPVRSRLSQTETQVNLGNRTAVTPPLFAVPLSRTNHPLEQDCSYYPPSVVLTRENPMGSASYTPGRFSTHHLSSACTINQSSPGFIQKRPVQFFTYPVHEYPVHEQTSSNFCANAPEQRLFTHNVPIASTTRCVSYTPDAAIPQPQMGAPMYSPVYANASHTPTHTLITQPLPNCSCYCSPVISDMVPLSPECCLPNFPTMYDSAPMYPPVVPMTMCHTTCSCQNRNSVHSKNWGWKNGWDHQWTSKNTSNNIKTTNLGGRMVPVITRARPVDTPVTRYTTQPTRFS